MNISVPDALAAEVRERNLPISAICQRALLDEVTKAREVEQETGIKVYPDDEWEDDPDYDPSRPHLTYGFHPDYGGGWTLWYGEAGADCVADNYFIGGDKKDVGSALREARWKLARLAEGLPITVEVGHPEVPVTFRGRWLVDPDPDETRTSMALHDAGAYWGVALTAKGRIAVFSAHCNDAWPAQLTDFDSLDAAASDGLPADIAARAAEELGEKRVISLDI